MNRLSFFLLLSLIIGGINANAVTVNIDLDINAHAKKGECEKYAARVREGVARYVQTEDQTERSQILEEIKKQKKKLKRCEKKKTKWWKKALGHVNGGSVSVDASF